MIATFKPLKKIFEPTRLISYYISTPIFYVNAAPHIGHVHTVILADALNRHNRLLLCDSDTLFTTGTDEHGIKVQQAAEKCKTDTKVFCDQTSNRYRYLFNNLDITVTKFVRTSEPSHIQAVEAVWNQLRERGHIYKSLYSGWYSESEECFVPSSQVIETKSGGEILQEDSSGNRLVWSEEENYVFSLSKFIDRIRNWIEKERPIVPARFNAEALAMLRGDDMKDLSISRSSKRLKWGIRVPNDPGQTIYVWIDALTNYLSAVGYPCRPDELVRWPVDCQVIGKDILKFHAIYWPAILMALSLPLPKRIICHSHWLVDSTKMSKSKGNVIYPEKELPKLTLDGLRYYLLRAGSTSFDTDYNPLQAVERVNNELADIYGNLISRCCSLAINPNQIIPTKLSSSSELSEISSRLSELAHSCIGHYNVADFYKGIDEIMAIMRLNNSLYEQYKPWKLVKQLSDDKSCQSYHDIQAITFETLRISSILLQPIVPRLASKALQRLGYEDMSYSSAKLMLSYGDSTLDQRALPPNQTQPLFLKIKV